jgi:hypothetical protein
VGGGWQGVSNLYRRQCSDYQSSEPVTWSTAFSASAFSLRSALACALHPARKLSPAPRHPHTQLKPQSIFRRLHERTTVTLQASEPLESNSHLVRKLSTKGPSAVLPCSSPRFSVLLPCCFSCASSWLSNVRGDL